MNCDHFSRLKFVTEAKTKPGVGLWGGALSETTENLNPLMFRSQDINKISEDLWESNAASNRIYNDLLPYLKEDKDIDGICLLLSSVKDLPEKWQADLLNFSFEENIDCIKKKSNMLRILLSIPYSDVVLLSHLRRNLSTNSTIKLLWYLAELLKSCRLVKDEAITSAPHLSQVVEWISLVLDAHHHELLIAGNDDKVKHLIKQLGQSVAESVSLT